MLDKLRRTDDVYSEDFHEALIVQSVEGTKDLAMPANDRTFKRTYISQVPCASQLLPSGPYFVHYGYLHQAWRLYEDHLDAFVASIVPKTPFCPKRYGHLSL